MLFRSDRPMWGAPRLTAWGAIGSAHLREIRRRRTRAQFATNEAGATWATYRLSWPQWI